MNNTAFTRGKIYDSCFVDVNNEWIKMVDIVPVELRYRSAPSHFLLEGRSEKNSKHKLKVYMNKSDIEEYGEPQVREIKQIE